MKFLQLNFLILCIWLGSALNINAQTVATDRIAEGSSKGTDHDERQSTLNLSRDLVRLGIASQNLVPDNPNLDARPLFQAALKYVAQHHTSILTVDHGSYYFLTSENAETY